MRIVEKETSRLYPCQISFNLQNCRRTPYQECSEIYVCEAYKINLQTDEQERTFWQDKKDRIEGLLEVTDANQSRKQTD